MWLYISSQKFYVIYPQFLQDPKLFGNKKLCHALFFVVLQICLHA